MATCSAFLAQWLRMPIPWMLGPLLCTATLSVCGAPMKSSVYLRNIGQWVIACALGLYFTAEVGQLIVGLWWAILLSIVWALAIGFGFGLWLQRQNAKDMPELSAAQMSATSYFAGAIGGASEMAIMADRHKARTDLVAASHSMRLVLVVLFLPFGMQWFQSHWGLHVDTHFVPGPKMMQWPGIFYLALATSAGALFMTAIKRNNPWFMGPLLVSMGLTLMGVAWTAIPAEMSSMAQLFIGVSLGVRFQRQFIQTAPKWLLTVTIGTVGMMLLSGVFGGLLAWVTGLHPATLILGTSPGGIAEMAITAKVLALGAPIVTAFQVCRLIAVLLIVVPLYRWVAVADKNQ